MRAHVKGCGEFEPDEYVDADVKITGQEAVARICQVIGNVLIKRTLERMTRETIVAKKTLRNMATDMFGQDHDDRDRAYEAMMSDETARQRYFLKVLEDETLQLLGEPGKEAGYIQLPEDLNEIRHRVKVKESARRLREINCREMKADDG